MDYIVKNTVGKLLEGKNPDEVASLRVLDPACGSGSFLIGAYQCILDWHRDWYLRNDAEQHTAQITQIKGVWRLTTEERKHILINNIYGVDIDEQAVETTKLSLLLRVLEGETNETLTSYQHRFHMRALPDLDKNIKCGNSLIGPDFYTDRNVDEETRRRINPFSWKTEFAPIMQAGGFDAVIGNPPYVRSIHLKEDNPIAWQYYAESFESAKSREWDIYLVFVEHGLELLNPTGKLGFIVPNKFLNSRVGEKLRELLAAGKKLKQLIHFGAFQIFKGATTYTCILFLDHVKKRSIQIARYTGQVTSTDLPCPLPEEQPSKWASYNVPANSLSGKPWIFGTSKTGLLEKLQKWTALEKFARVFKGTGTNADGVYLLSNRGVENGLIRVFSPELNSEVCLEPTFLKPVLRGRSINRYDIVDHDLLLLVPYELNAGHYTLAAESTLADLAPETLAYLKACQTRLDNREKGRFIGTNWYQYGRPQNMDRFDIGTKIVIPDVANRGACYLDVEGKWLLDTAYAIIPKPDVQIDLRYLLGILNSPILTYFLKETGTALRGGYFRMKTAYLNPFPIRPINFSDSTDKMRHDKMIELVDQMLILHQQLAEANTPSKKTQLQRQIEATDKQIDALVYELYGLTDEEIKIIEGEAK